MFDSFRCSSPFTYSLRLFRIVQIHRVISILEFHARDFRRTTFGSVRVVRSNPRGCRRSCFDSFERVATATIVIDFDDVDLCYAPAMPMNHHVEDDWIYSSRNQRDPGEVGCTENNVGENVEVAKKAVVDDAELNDYES